MRVTDVTIIPWCNTNGGPTKEQWAIQASQDENTDLTFDMHSNHSEKHIDLMESLYLLDAVTLEQRFLFP